MISQEALQRINDLAVRTFDPLGIEVVEFKPFPMGSSITLRFLVDRVGGVTLDECTQLNRRLGELIEREIPIERSYVLEISSPGLDRPIVGPKDFKRVLGEKIHLWLKEPYEGKIEWEGVVSSVSDSGIALSDGFQKETVLSFGIINKAKRIIG